MADLSALLGNALLSSKGLAGQPFNPDAPKPQMPQMPQMQQLLEMPQGGTVQQSQQPRLPAPVQKQDSGLRSFLGNIGDALLVANGKEPLYKQGVERKRLGAELAQYLGTDDPELANIFRNNPEAGMQLYNALREDKRFDRTAGQADQQIGISRDNANRGWAELGQRGELERERIGTTQRGQDIQLQLGQAQNARAAAERGLRVALQRGDHAHAERMLGLRNAADKELVRLRASLGGGGDMGTETVTEEYPATKEGGFMGIGSKTVPGRTVVTKRPLQTQQQQGPSQADLEYTAKKHGISVEEVKRRLGQN